MKYSIEFGNLEGYFSIDENTGEIKLEKNIPLEENKVLQFPLYVAARDGESRYSLCLQNVKVLSYKQFC